MAAKKSKKEGQDEAPREPIAVLVARFAITITILALIAHVAVFFAVGTDGFKAFLEEKLSEDLGVDVTMTRARATWVLNVVCEEVKGGAEGAAAFELDAVAVGWSRRNLWIPGKSPVKKVSIDGGWIRFGRTVHGTWAPGTLSPLGKLVADAVGFRLQLPDDRPVEISRSSRVGRWLQTLQLGMPVDTQLEIENVKVEFAQADIRAIRTVDELDLVVTPIELPNRYLSHVLLRAASVAGPRGVRRDIAYESVHSDTVEAVFEGGAGAELPDTLMVQRPSLEVVREETVSEIPPRATQSGDDPIRQSLKKALE